MKTKTNKLQVDEKDLEWLAGVFDARATCEIATIGERLQPRVRFNTAIPEITETIASVCHLATTIHTIRSRADHNPTHVLTIGGHNAVALCKVIAPYLRTSKKRAQAELLARFPFGVSGRKVTHDMTAQRESLRREIEKYHSDRPKRYTK